MIRYKIKEHTNEGRLIAPMWRGQYDYADSYMFDDYSGYASVEEAHAALMEFERREKHLVYEKLVVLPFLVTHQ